ncbi:hypothetical protein HY992_05730 [Candidatus Micrarchaeota archaeon]|nr:hypothetical protein [Candidatus Micrarchaeota archaeon]
MVEKKTKAFLLAATISLFFLFACIASMNEQAWRAGQPEQGVDLVPEDVQPDTGPCLCSKCIGGTAEHTIFNLIDFGDPTLRNAQCSFIACDFKSRDEEKTDDGITPVFASGVDPATYMITTPLGSMIETVPVTSVESLLADEDAVKLPFMIGQGGTFAEFEKAQAWCPGQYKLAVKWLEGGQTTLGSGATATVAPPQPYKKQAECLLDANIIPVYIWYTRGTNLNYDKSQNHEYAAKLNGVGPAIVTPEAMYDSSDGSVVTKVKNQLKGINEDCPNCLVMLVPREATGEAYIQSIEKVIPKVQFGVSPSADVDLIGRIVAVDETYDCDFDKALTAAADDAKETMKNFRKPTMLLLYMPYDGVTCTKAPPSGGTVGETVTFDVGYAANKYELLAENTHSMLLPNGIIAVAPMQMQDRKPTPDDVYGNKYGFMKLTVYENYGAKNPALKAWFDKCTLYYTQDDSATVPSINKGYWQSLMITSYQGKTGQYCEAHNNVAVQAANPGLYNFDRYKETTTPYTSNTVPTTTSKIEQCILKEEYAPRTGKITSDWGMLALSIKYGVTLPFGGSYVPESNYKLAVAAASEKCDIDKSLLRAILSESSQLTTSALDPGDANYKVGKICAYWQQELDLITKVEGEGGAGFKVVTDEALMRRIKQKAAFFTALDYDENERGHAPFITSAQLTALRFDSKFYEKICMPPAPPPPADGSTPPTPTIPVGLGITFPCEIVDAYVSV